MAQAAKLQEDFRREAGVKAYELKAKKTVLRLSDTSECSCVVLWEKAAGSYC